MSRKKRGNGSLILMCVIIVCLFAPILAPLILALFIPAVCLWVFYIFLKGVSKHTSKRSSKSLSDLHFGD